MIEKIKTTWEATGPVKCDIPYISLRCPHCTHCTSEAWYRNKLEATILFNCDNCKTRTYFNVVVDGSGKYTATPLVPRRPVIDEPPW